MNLSTLLKFIPSSKATGAELNTGTDDVKYATAKALLDSKYARIDEATTFESTLAATNLSGTNTGDQTLPVKATGTEVNTGTDDAKFVTSKAIKDSSYIRVEDILNSSSTVTGDFNAITPSANYRENEYYVTALANVLTINAPSATPANGNTLLIRIKDNGTARALTWNSIYRAIGVTIPTTTTISKTLYIGCIYNSTDSKWDVVAVNEEE